MKNFYRLLLCYVIFCGANYSIAQTCPGSPFITYPGGDSSWYASHTNGWCYDNLVAGQTYCFSFTMSDTFEVDININGCSSCPKTMYLKLAGNSTFVRDTNTCNFSSGTNCVTFSSCAGCNTSTYGPSCNLISNNIKLGAGCSGFVKGEVYTYCFTVPSGCGGMSICPLIHCDNCALPPVVNALGGRICPGDCYSLSATASSGTSPYTYSWSPNIGSGAGPFTVCPSTTTTYTVTITDANGISASDTARVTLKTAPGVSAGTGATICNGVPATLTATGAATYSWSPSAGLSNPTIANPVATPSVSTTYTVTGTAANGCTAADAVTITVNQPPVISISPPAPEVCSGGPVSLTAGGGTSYIWSKQNGDLSDTVGGTVYASPVAATTYTVTATDVNGCTSTKSVTVNVNALPAIDISPAGAAVCNGNAVLLTATGGISYIWQHQSGDLSDTTGSTVFADPVSTTTYTLTGTDAKGCTNTKTVTVDVNPLPVVAIAPPAPVICTGQSLALTASGGISYVWKPQNGDLSDTVGTTVSVNPSSAKTYTVTGTDSNGCYNTSSVTVNVNPLPILTISPSAPAVCSGKSVSITAAGGTSYIWQQQNGDLSDTVGSTVIATPTATTTYTITATDTNGCTKAESVEVKVNDLPVLAVSPSSPSVCSGQSVALTAGGADIYVWKQQNGDLSDTVGTTVSASPAATTTYTVIGTDTNGCVNTSTVTVAVKPLPVINAGSDLSICSDDSVQLNVTGAPLGSTYLWTPDITLSCNNCANTFAKPAVTTNYTVTATSPDGCSAQDSVNVIVTSIEAVAGPDTVICSGDYVLMYAGGGLSYQWSPAAGLSNSTISNPVATPTVTTSYTVTISSGTCSSTATAAITVRPGVQTPVIYQSGDTLTCNNNSYTFYQWYYNSVIIPGATTPIYIAPQSGNYNLVVYNEYGCHISVGINIIILGLPNSFAGNSISLSPNPAFDELDINGLLFTGYQLEIYNLLGEKVFESKIIPKQPGDNNTYASSKVDIAALSKGIYIVRLVNAATWWTAKLVKE